MIPLIISAPFGNYFQPEWAIPTLGTFTYWARRTNRNQYNERLWWLGLAWRMATTLRYHRRLGGWTNRLGLKNPGINSLLDRVRYKHLDLSRKIVSIHGFTLLEWDELFRQVRLVAVKPLAVELNVSCPNVEVSTLAAIADVFKVARGRLPDHRLIAKLPPLHAVELARRAVDEGIDAVHCTNTLPCPGGGLSGATLRPLAVNAVRDIRERFGSKLAIVGGGGVLLPEHALEFVEAGAGAVAIGSGLLRLTGRRAWAAEIEKALWDTRTPQFPIYWLGEPSHVEPDFPRDPG